MFQYVKEIGIEIRAIRGIDARGWVSIASINFRRQSFLSLYYSSNFTTTYRLFQRDFFNVMWVIYLKTCELLFDYFEWIVHICLFLTCNLDSVTPWSLNAQDPCHTVIILIYWKIGLRCNWKKLWNLAGYLSQLSCAYICARSRNATGNNEDIKIPIS